MTHRIESLSIKQNALLSLVLLAGFSLSLCLRLIAGGADPARSVPAGVIFAVCLVSLCLAAGTRLKISWRGVVIGLAGGLFLCLPALVIHNLKGSSVMPAGNYLFWAAAISFVAFAEEAFLRGALFTAVNQWLGQTPAILIAAAAFALLHLPLYGLHVLPLDFAVGLWLGSLRAISGSFVAPGIAHTLADLVGWWL